MGVLWSIRRLAKFTVNMKRNGRNTTIVVESTKAREGDGDGVLSTSSVETDVYTTVLVPAS
jgi:hypothetical protein